MDAFKRLMEINIVSSIESKEIRKRYDELWSKIRDLIKSIKKLRWLCWKVYENQI